MSRSSILLGCRRANSSIALGISRAKSRWTARKLSSDKRAPDIDERLCQLVCQIWGVLEHEKHHARYASVYDRSNLRSAAAIRHGSTITSTIQCPTCRTKHNLPTNGVRGLSTNFTLANLVELLSFHDPLDPSTKPSLAAAHKCENEIDDNPAASKCLDCDFYLCKDCTALHEKQRSTKNHKVISIAEIKSGGVKQLSQKRYCMEHDGEELKLYCKTCQEVICRDCTIVTHKQHNYAFVKDVTDVLTKKLNSLSVNVRRKDTDLQRLMQHIIHEKQVEREKLASNNHEVKQFFAKCVSEDQARIAALQEHIIHLQQCETTLTADLATLSSLHMKQLSTLEEELQFSRTRISSALSFSEQLLSSASSTDLAMTSKQVAQQFQTLTMLPSDKNMVKNSPWSLALSKSDPLKSKALKMSLADKIVISMPQIVQLGKNTFQVSLKKLEENDLDINVNVSVTLSSGQFCPVKIQPRKQRTWSVNYFISPPCPADEITVSVAVGGFEPKESPFKFSCENQMAEGTKVQQHGGKLRGTVSANGYQYHYSGTSRANLVPVNWDRSTEGYYHYNVHSVEMVELSLLKVIPE